MTLTAEQLFEEYYSTAEITIYKMYPSPENLAKQNNLELEDLFKYARLGLWRACLNYDPSRAKFITHAINNIKWYVIERLNRETSLIHYHTHNRPDEENQYRITSMDEPLLNTEEDGTYHDVVSDGYDLQDDVVIRKDLERYFSGHFNEDMVDILSLKGEGQTYKVIGKKYGISGERVRQKIQKAKRLLEHVNWEVETV